MNSNWVNNNNNNNTTRRTNSPSTINEKFPALAKPTKKNFVNPNSQPIRYTTILKPQPKKKAILMNISQTSNSDYTPNYLNNINNRTSSSSSSSPSMPILGNGSSSGAGGGGGGFTSSGSSSFASSRNSSSTALDDKKFPTLQKKNKLKK